MDTLGNPTGFYLTPGQGSDLEGADVLLHYTPPGLVIVDKDYAPQARVIEPLIQPGKTMVIPCLQTRAYSVTMTGICTRTAI